jgi:L-rhamnose mutarotase
MIGKEKTLRRGVAILCLLAVSGCSSTHPLGKRPVERHGVVIGIPAQGIPEYKRLHAETWPGVLKAVDRAHMDNYSIYLGEVAPERHYLFGYYEYTGKDFDADMARMKKDKTMQQWWKLTDPLQEPLPTRGEGEWWSQWEEVFHYAGPTYDKSDVKLRWGSIVGVRQENLLTYTQLHAAVWPGVLAALERVNIRNYSIYLGQVTPGEYLLFSYFEYVGDDFEADMKRMAQDKVTQFWWTYTDPLQIRLPGTPEGAQWKAVEEIFQTD